MAIGAGNTILASDIQAIKDDVDALISAATSVLATSETTGSSSFVNLATSGPSVTLTTGTAALVVVSCRMSNSTGGAACLMDFDVSGASSRSAVDSTGLKFESSSANDELRASAIHLLSPLTAGSNTFTAKYRVTGGTGTFSERRIIVIPLGG